MLYYIGEFGYFNVLLINAIEKYLTRYPRERLEIKTYKDYGDILKLLFKDKVIIYEIRLETYRVQTTLISGIPKELKKDKNICDMLKITGVNLNNIEEFGYIEKPLFYEMDFIGKPYKFISIFARQRPLDLWRNMRYDELLMIIRIIRELFSDYKIVLHGNEIERIETEGVITIRDINESIFYLNKSELLITTNTGFIDFAKNCNTRHILMLETHETGVSDRYHMKFKPFDSNFMIIQFRVIKDYWEVLKNKIIEIKSYIDFKY